MTALAIEVEVNGKRIALAGANDLKWLAAGMGVGGGPEKRKLRADIDVFRLSVAGESSALAECAGFLTWIDGLPLRIGDSVTFRIVQAEQPDPPALVHPVIFEGERSGLTARSSATRRKRRAPNRRR